MSRTRRETYHAPRRGIGRYARGPVPTCRPLLVLTALLACVALGCDAGPPPVTPTPRAGTPDAPREVNLIAKDYAFLPATLDLIPGETVLLHLINGGLEVHEAVIGDAAVQAAWEAAEAATDRCPARAHADRQRPTGRVAALRVVVRSGERVDLHWTVPADVLTGSAPGRLDRRVHIPGHLANGMSIPIRWIAEPAS